MNWTTEHSLKLQEIIDRTDYIPSGLGTDENPCTIAMIHIAYNGELSDEVLECTSDVIAMFAMRIQDLMSWGLRNSKEWREIIPLIPATGKDMEQERLAVLRNWIFEEILPLVDEKAAADGHIAEWLKMCHFANNVKETIKQIDMVKEFRHMKKNFWENEEWRFLMPALNNTLYLSEAVDFGPAETDYKVASELAADIVDTVISFAYCRSPNDYNGTVVTWENSGVIDIIKKLIFLEPSSET